MKLNFKSPLILLATATVLFATPCWAGSNLRHSLSAPPSDEPVIAAVRGRKVRVTVPAGFHEVTLQKKTSRRKTPWVTLSTSVVNGEAKVVTFTLRSRLSKRSMRVVGRLSGALPSAFYTGTTNFLGEQVVSQPGSNLSFGSSTSSGSVNVTLGGAGSAISDTSSASGNAARTVTESDIWKLDGDRLYFFNQYRGLQNIDISDVAMPVLLGTLRMPDAGEDLYQLDSTHVAILKRTPKELGWTSGSPSFDQLNQSGEIVVCDVSTAEPTIVARVPFEGWIANSRLIGSSLVIAKNVARNEGNNWSWRTDLEVTGYDLSSPATPVVRNTVSFANTDGHGVSAVQASNERFMVARPTYDYSGAGRGYETQVHLVDVTNPNGTLAKGGTASVRGHVADKFKLHEKGGVMSVVSAVSGWSSDQSQWSSYTQLENFDVSNIAAPVSLGEIAVGQNESTRAVRFDGDRVYVVTVVQQDPLWIIDNADPTSPTLSGELHVPGFSSYIEPLGDRLVTVGRLWGDDGTGNWQNRVTVSLYDVADAANPIQLSQLPVGTGWTHSEAEWDEKAFTVLPEAGLIMLPYSEGWWLWGSGRGGVQLLDLNRDSLALRGVIEHGFTPRRTAVKNDTVIAVSAADLLTVNIADRDNPVVKADVELAWNVSRVWIAGKYLLQLGQHLNDRSPVLSVSPVENTADTISTLELGTAPVLASELKGDILYVVQTVAGATVNSQDVKLTIFSVASLPSIVKHGEATAPVSSNYGDFNLLFPTDATAVVARSNRSYSWDWPVFNTLEIGDAATIRHGNRGRSTFTWANPSVGWWGRQGTSTFELFGFDVSNSRAPQYLTTTLLNREDAAAFSEAFAENGKVFASHYTGGRYGHFITLASGTANQETANRHFLNVINFADPAAPAVAEPVSLPGELRGVVRDLLYVVGPGYDAAGKPDSSKQFIHAAAFDGAAHLVDSIELSGQTGDLWTSSNFRLGNGNVFVSRSRYNQTTGDETPAFEAWTLSDLGKFTLRDTLPLPGFYDWSIVGDLALIPSGGSTFSVVNVANPSDLQLIGHYGNPNSYSWYYGYGSCANIVGNLSLGFWIPEGDYGVRYLPAPQ